MANYCRAVIKSPRGTSTNTIQLYFSLILSVYSIKINYYTYRNLTTREIHSADQVIACDRRTIILYRLAESIPGLPKSLKILAQPDRKIFCRYTQQTHTKMPKMYCMINVWLGFPISCIAAPCILYNTYVRII